jgi:hypothetical protein
MEDLQVDGRVYRKRVRLYPSLRCVVVCFYVGMYSRDRELVERYGKNQRQRQEEESMCELRRDVMKVEREEKR